MTSDVTEPGRRPVKGLIRCSPDIGVTAVLFGWTATAEHRPGRLGQTRTGNRLLRRQPHVLRAASRGIVETRTGVEPVSGGFADRLPPGESRALACRCQ